MILCGYEKTKKDELNLQDTGVTGLEAAEAYLKHVDELSSKTLDDSLVQHVE